MKIQKIKYHVLIDLQFADNRTAYIESYCVFKNTFEWTFIEKNAETFEDNGRMFYLISRAILIDGYHFENPQMILTGC